MTRAALADRVKQERGQGGMTVGELIDVLREFPPEMEATVRLSRNDLMVTDIREQRAYLWNMRRSARLMEAPMRAGPSSP